jgi:LAO/AO transport system kinase
LIGQHGNPEHAHHDQKLWHPQVLQLSALKSRGIGEFWDAITRFRELQTANGRLAARRHAQDQAWMWERIRSGLLEKFLCQPGVRTALRQCEADVRNGLIAPSAAARALLNISFRS